MVTSTGLLRLLCRIGQLDSHVRQIVALIVAVIAFLLSSRYGRASLTHFIAIWDIYAIVVVVMAWATIWTADPRTSPIAGFKPNPNFHLRDRRRMHEFAGGDSGNP